MDSWRNKPNVDIAKQSYRACRMPISMDPQQVFPTRMYLLCRNSEYSNNDNLTHVLNFIWLIKTPYSTGIHVYMTCIIDFIVYVLNFDTFFDRFVEL